MGEPDPQRDSSIVRTAARVFVSPSMSNAGSGLEVSRGALIVSDPKSQSWSMARYGAY